MRVKVLLDFAKVALSYEESIGVIVAATKTVTINTKKRKQNETRRLTNLASTKKVASQVPYPSAMETDPPRTKWMLTLLLRQNTHLASPQRNPESIPLLTIRKQLKPRRKRRREEYQVQGFPWGLSCQSNPGMEFQRWREGYGGN